MADTDCDFFERVPHYADKPKAISRLKSRWRMVVEPIIPDIQGKTMLDLGAHDGRWAYAYAQAGAAHVTAVEARAELISKFQHYPDAEVKARIDMVCDDIFSFLESAVAAGKTYDCIAVLGFFYHTMDHFRLLVLISQLKPDVIIIDGEFIASRNAVIQILTERTDKDLNAAPLFMGQEKTLVGVPSDAAMERMADALGYKLDWLDVVSQKEQVDFQPKDYQRKQRKRRRTCFLSPQS